MEKVETNICAFSDSFPIAILPQEPDEDGMASFFDPIVNELNVLYAGVYFDIPGLGRRLVRVALYCVVCDFPARQKVLGFSGWMGCYGCTRCSRKFGWIKNGTSFPAL